MSRALRLASILLAASALLAPAVGAGIPFPCWNAETDPPPLGCQYRFRPTGGLDELVIHVTLRDFFCMPVPHCSTSAVLEPTPKTLALCSCDGLRTGGFTDADGAIDLVFDRIGGRGELMLAVTAHCAGDIAIAAVPVTFTSPDLDGSCDASSGAVGVIDLGIWAGGLHTYRQSSDFNCDGIVGVIDLGIWAQAMGTGCP